MSLGVVLYEVNFLRRQRVTSRRAERIPEPTTQLLENGPYFI